MAKELCIASWNLENFFDRFDDPYRNDQSSSPTSTHRQERIAKVLRFIDADLVGVQEVENRFLLERFLRRHFPKSGYEVVLIEGNDGRGIDVGLLSRLPIRSSTSYRHRHFPTHGDRGFVFRRDLLRVEIGGPQPFDIYVAHLKSQRGDRGAESIRIAEAKEIVKILREESKAHHAYRAILVGDLNEKPHGPALKILKRAGLHDPMADLDLVTYHHKPHRGRIDYTLVTEAMMKWVKGGEVVEQAPGVDVKECSDHFPITLKLAPFIGRSQPSD